VTTIGPMSDSWLPSSFARPLRVEVLPGVHLRPISADDLDIDMPAVMGNQQMLWDKYGEEWGWPPADMTAEEDRSDLARHADEMERNESFNYAILPEGEGRLFGCIYVDPPEDPGEGLVADVSWWVVPDAPAGLADAMRTFVPAWLSSAWPFVDVRYPFGEVG